MPKLARIAVAMIAAAFSTLLCAQTFPSRPVRLVVPFPPGGGTDILGRVLANKLGDALGEPVIVDNRPGGGSIIGSEIVARSSPDGHTLLLTSASHAINPSVYPRLPYDTLHDFSAVSHVATVPIILVVNSSLPVASVQELIAFAKSRPGQLNVGASTSGSVFHLAAELFKSTAGIDMVYVSFKGASPAVTALLANHVNVLFETLLTIAPHAREGKLRPLAVGGLRRASTLPELPTMAESGFPEFSAENWYGLYVRAGTPKATVDRLNHEIVKALRQPEVRERLVSQSVELVGSSPKEHEQFLKSEMAKWGRIARLTNARAD